MIIHLDTDNPKSIEQKVQELILKKLYIKVDDAKIFTNKEDFIELILKDVIVVSKAEFDLDKALKIALKEQQEYRSIPDTKKNQLEEVSIEFAVEIDAYIMYLSGLGEGLSDDELYMNVLTVLNCDPDFFEKKMQELIMESLSQKFSEAEAEQKGLDYDLLISTYSSHVKVLASNESAEAAAEEYYYSNEDFYINNNLGIDFIKNELERCEPILSEEISAYKMALDLESQNAEIPMILAMTKQLLNLAD